MSFIFDTYIPGHSLLHKLDPRVKLLGTAFTLMLVFWLPGLALQCLFLGVLHIILLCAGIPGSRILNLWRQMAVLLVLIMVLQPLFLPAGDLLLKLGPLRLTTGGILDALRLAVRASGFAFAMAVLLTTTDHHALVLAFVRMGLPYTWGLTISLALRFLPAIHSMFHAVKDAQAARGWLFSGGVFQRLRDYLPVLIAVIVGTLRMSDQLTLALAARGLGTPTRRTRWRDLHMRRSDWLCALGLASAFVAFIWWRAIIY
ncbi:MAG: energy-coupling factor transporter transmembrane component T [Anaerolineae bacterium]|nr:energy-coupling factor transporter transmembrane component T [Anaerolineae bacterium]